jgi:hypothetical protein
MSDPFTFRVAAEKELSQIIALLADDILGCL